MIAPKAFYSFSLVVIPMVRIMVRVRVSVRVRVRFGCSQGFLFVFPISNSHPISWWGVEIWLGLGLGVRGYGLEVRVSFTS